MTAADSSPEVEAERTRVVAGEIVELRFPDGYVRGVGYYLSRRDGNGWSAPLYALTAALGGGDHDCPAPGRRCPSWTPIEEAQDWFDEGFIGPGPDWIVIPDDALPGRYRVCEAQAGDHPYCAELDVLERSERAVCANAWNLSAAALSGSSGSCRGR
jgi:hypothetical protein